MHLISRCGNCRWHEIKNVHEDVNHGIISVLLGHSLAQARVSLLPSSSSITSAERKHACRKCFQFIIKYSLAFGRSFFRLSSRRSANELRDLKIDSDLRSAMCVDGTRAKSRLIFVYHRRYVDGSFKRRIKQIANRKLSHSMPLFQTFVCTRGVHFSNEQSNKRDESSWKVHAENARLPFDSLLAAGTSRIAPIKSQSSCEISTQRGSQSRC